MKPALPKKIMRSLPTLTEVIDAAAQRATESSSQPDSAAARAALVEQVMQELAPMIEARIELQLQRAISDLLHEQVQLLQPRIRQKVDAAVRKVVTQVVSVEDGPLASGGNKP